MHMADALLSPTVGVAMTAVSVAMIGYSAKKIAGDNLDEKKIPMMGVMGAFVFAAQMINFTIPGTGASGHIGGGILLAALLGPFPALLTMASVLLIQCLFFADGGLLAYGCNVFNLGVCVCLFAYQFFYKPLIKRGMTKKNIILASVISVVIGLQIGSLGVVLQTVASGVTELPFGAFLILMQPIHILIGLIEGVVTAAVLCFVLNARPELLESSVQNAKIAAGVPMKKIMVTFLILAVLIGGGLSLLASTSPDGLEWAIEGVAGTAELERDGVFHHAMEKIVSFFAFMPDYSFAGDEKDSLLGTSTAGLVGGAITIVLAGSIGFIIRAARKKTSATKTT